MYDRYMDMDQFREKYLPLVMEHKLSFVLGIVGISFLGYGLISLVGVQRDSTEITFQSGQNPANVETKTTHKQITIDVEGAVLKPGIHTLPAESRVQDALILAGGMSQKADVAKVAQSMNLAAKVIDGGKIYIPFEGEPSNTSIQSGGQNSSENTLGVSTGLININTAGETELDTLSGVGPATAQKIISARPYGSVDELLSKKAVGKSVFEKIKEKVTVN